MFLRYNIRPNRRPSRLRSRHPNRPRSPPDKRLLCCPGSHRARCQPRHLRTRQPSRQPSGQLKRRLYRHPSRRHPWSARERRAGAAPSAAGGRSDASRMSPVRAIAPGGTDRRSGRTRGRIQKSSRGHGHHHFRWTAYLPHVRGPSGVRAQPHSGTYHSGTDSGKGAGSQRRTTQEADTSPG